MLDAYGREIDYLRMSVTDKCDLSCAYCKPRPVPKLLHGDLLSVEEMTEFARAFKELGGKKVRLTGGEPLLRRGVVTLAENLSGLGLETAMTTNAARLAQYAAPLKEAGVERLNISLDTLDEAAYRSLTKGELKNALDGIAAALDAGFELKLNAVLQRGVNEDITPLCEYAESIGAELRFIELMPFASTREYFNGKFLPCAETAARFGMTEAGRKGIVKYFAFDRFKVGFIAPLGGKFCSFCNRLRITATGKVLPCLHGAERFDVRPYFGDSEKLKAFISACIRLKPACHALEKGNLQSEDMGSIGG